MLTKTKRKNIKKIESQKKKVVQKKSKKNSSFKVGKFIFKFILFSILSVFIFTLVINIYIIESTNDYIYTELDDVPHKYTVIVPGASVINNRSVSYVLRDRIEAGIDLLNNGNVEKFIVSGDHGQIEYDEVNTARKYILKMHDIDTSRIFMDHAGFSTYETMYRARDVFCIDECCIASQYFHLNRCVYIARSLGLDAVGYVAPEINTFRRKLKMRWELREYFARVKAFFSVKFNAKPKYLGDKIPITGDGHATWE